MPNSLYNAASALTPAFLRQRTQIPGMEDYSDIGTESYLNTIYLSANNAVLADKQAALINNSNLKAEGLPVDISAVGLGAMTPQQVAAQEEGSPKLLKLPTQIEGGDNSSPSLGEKFSSSALGLNSKAINQALDTVGNITNSLPGAANTYDGPKGNVRKSIDEGYNAIADAAANFGPYGQMASMAMKAANMLNGILGAIFGATDGMCVCAGTKVFTAKGEIVNIEDLKLELGIIGWNEESKEIRPQTIPIMIEPREKECVEITLKSGQVLRCSIDHPILSDNSPKAKMKTINGKRMGIRLWKFRRADELRIGDFVGLANDIDYWGDKELPSAYLVGMLIGDGSYGKGASCRIISADPDTWNYLEDNNLAVINHCDDSRPEKYSKEIRTYRIIGGMELMKSLGIAYLTGVNKTLPKNIGDYNKSSICLLIAGLYDTDGSFSVNEDKNQYSITLYLSNKPLLEEVRMLLYKLGIMSTIGTRKAAKYELGGHIINSKESYRLEVHDFNSVKKFHNYIHLNISYKLDCLNKIYAMIKDKPAKEHNDISGAKLSKIIDIKPIGLLIVYNLLADTDHTYLAECIITHNTTTDAVLDSPLGFLTGVGWINQAFGDTSDTITKDEETFELVGSSYGGTGDLVDDALTKSGKKYGAFSRSAMNEANREISKAKYLQSLMADIAKDASNRNAIKSSMAAINGNKRELAMLGGYNQAAIHAGKHGMLIQKAKRIVSQYNNHYTIIEGVPEFKEDGGKFDVWEYKEVPTFKEGGKSKRFEKKPDSYADWVKEVNSDYLNDNYDLELAYNTLPFDELENWRIDPENNHLSSVSPVPNETGRIPFLKKGRLTENPELAGEIEYFITNPELSQKYGLHYNDNDRRYEYVLKEPEKFQKGGEFNILPEGELHARKHSIDVEGITKKGIPVISESEGGEIQQHAEIERDEIIFRLEVTEKIEEARKKYEEASNKEKDELSLEIGKLLTEEILHNTKNNE